MSELTVRVLKLESMRVASAYGFGSEPEFIAHEKMAAFLKAKDLLEGYGAEYRHFGFNNPNPSPGSPNYGYEVWVNVGQDVEPEGDIRILDFPGGLYAVTRCENVANIGRVWGELAQWRASSKYKEGNHQWLENLHNPLETAPTKFVFDLYIPISE